VRFERLRFTRVYLI